MAKPPMNTLIQSIRMEDGMVNGQDNTRTQDCWGENECEKERDGMEDRRNNGKGNRNCNEDLEEEHHLHEETDIRLPVATTTTMTAVERSMIMLMESRHG